MYLPQRRCRACESGNLVEVFSLGVQPLANDFCTDTQERAGFAPLTVIHCERCFLAQLSVVVSPKILYANYPYVTSKSRMMQDHFGTLLTLLKQRQHRTLLEIGSNDGAFLRWCQQNGIADVVGIDPAENLASEASINGTRTISGTFNKTTAEQAGVVDLVVARHVFCHVADWKQFIDDLSIVTHEDSTVFLEVPYLLDMLERVEFDTIYHEHTSYLPITAMERLLDGTQWFLEHVERFQIHGGAVGMFLRRRATDGIKKQSVDDMCASEIGLPILWKQFRRIASERISTLRNVVEDLNSSGQRVCGFGASAKSTVWVNSCGFTAKQIQFICDCTPQKIGRTSPGSDIPIVGEENLNNANYAVLWAWNYKDEVLSRKTAFRKQGGKFIVPIPSLTIE